MANRRVVITGMGVVTSFGQSLSDTWDCIVNGRSGVKTIEKFDTSDYPVHIGGEITNFDPTPLIEHREAKRIDTFALYAMVGAINAVKDSGLELDSV
ncbi:MAG: hypothetical protein K9M57_05665, partial [Phycisphaerae bacterium]|nr:hypothetical protein [Phycisphaerae bacterium]